MLLALSDSATLAALVRVFFKRDTHTFFGNAWNCESKSFTGWGAASKLGVAWRF